MCSTLTSGLSHTALDMWHTVQTHPVMTAALVGSAFTLIHRWEHRQWHQPVRQWVQRHSTLLAQAVPENLGMGMMLGAIAVGSARLLYHSTAPDSSNFLHAVGTVTIGVGMLILVRSLHAIAHRAHNTSWSGGTRVLAHTASAACIAEDLLPALQVAKPVATWINTTVHLLLG